MYGRPYGLQTSCHLAHVEHNRSKSCAAEARRVEPSDGPHQAEAGDLDVRYDDRRGAASHISKDTRWGVPTCPLVSKPCGYLELYEHVQA